MEQNKNVANDGVVDTHKLKSKKLIFNESSHAKISTPNTRFAHKANQESKKSKPPFIFGPKIEFTPLGKPHEIVLCILLTNNIITLREARSFEPQIKPK